MSDCIDALITANIKATLQTVTPAKGYNTDCGTVEEKRSLFQMPDDNKPFTMLKNYLMIPKTITSILRMIS